MDYNLFLKMNNLVNKWINLDSLAIFFAKYFIYYLIAGAIFFVFLIKTKKEKIRYIFLAGVSIIFSRLMITELIRLVWYRPRPFISHQVNLLVEHSASGSFPSGHSVFLFTLAMAIFFFNKKIGIIFFALSFLVGLARVFIGFHYPLDIFGGFIIGVFSAWLVFISFKSLTPK